MVNDVIITQINAVADIDSLDTHATVSLAPIESLTMYYDVVSHGVTNSFGRTDLVVSD